MSLVRPYKECDYAALAASGARKIRPRRDARDWPVTDADADSFKEVVLVGATAHEAQGIAASALDKWPEVEGVLAVLQVQAAARTWSCGLDVIVLQETKLSLGGGGGQKAIRHFFAKRGWQCFWGCPLDTRGGVCGTSPGAGSPSR